MEAALVVEITIDLGAVPDDDTAAADAARARALRGAVREEWDLVTLSAARALRRHLLGRGHASRLMVARAIADEPPELLVRSDDAGE